MKTHITFFAMLALAILAAGCTADITGDGRESQKDLQGMTALKVTLNAFPADDEPETKTQLDDNDKFLWSPGDCINLIFDKGNGSVFTYNGSEPARFAPFDGTVNVSFGFDPTQQNAPDLKFWGVYPYSQDNEVIETDGGGRLLHTTIPWEQASGVNTWGQGQAVYVGQSGNLAMGFRNVGGGLVFHLTEEGVREMRIKGNNNEVIAGDVFVAMVEGVPEIRNFGENQKTVITLTPEDGGTFLVSDDNHKYYYYLTLPPVNFTDGLTVTLVKDSESATRQYSPKEIERNKFSRYGKPVNEGVTFRPSGSITFADANFEAYMGQFDTDHDGEISAEEAGDVTKVEVITDDITSLGGIEHFPNLKELRATGSSVSTKGTKAAGAGQLQSIDVSANTKLEILDCRGNQITTIDVSNNPALTVLECTDNPQLETISLAPDQVIPTLESPVAANVVYEWNDGDEIQGPDEIWYTTVDGNPVNLSSIASFGDVNVVSNTNVDGKGVLKFSGPVITIGRAAFENSNLSSVTLPEGVTTLSDFAFGHCSDLVSLTLPSTLTRIGGYAFTSCIKLTYFTIPDSVNEIGDAAFLNLKSVKAFQGPYASSDHKYLIKDGTLITIAAAGVTEYVIPSNVTIIGNYAFSGYEDIQSVTIPSSVTSIGERAFEQNSFTSINLPENLQSIDKQAFFLCDGLTTVTIPQSVASIGDAAFSYCKNLREFNGKFASDDHRCLIINGRIVSFAYAGLTEYIIPSNVTDIPFGIFTNNTNLTSISVPDGVETINYSAFSGCTALTSFTIPESVTLIYDSAFTGCSSLNSITVLPSNPPTLQDWDDTSNIFANTNNCPIYVPAASVEAYKTADGWSDFADRITAFSGTVSDFPDSGFRAYVFDNFDTDGNGILSQAECDTVTSIVVSTDNISSIQGIECFKNLVTLSCTGSRDPSLGTGDSWVWEASGLLTSLDVSHNTALTHINCNNNRITSLDLSHNTALTHLSCDGNGDHLRSIDVSLCTGLTSLSCYQNNLESLDLSSNSALTYVRCDPIDLDMSNHTALTEFCYGSSSAHVSSASLNLSGCIALTTLDLYHVNSVDLSGCTSLAELYLSSSSISNLDLSQATALRSIYMNMCGFQSLDVSDCTSLDYMSFVFCNSITSLNINSTSLTTLSCLDNAQLSSLDLSHLPALTTLECCNSNLTELDVSNNTALTSLDCTGNPMTTLYLKTGQTIPTLNKPDTTAIVYVSGEVSGNLNTEPVNVGTNHSW